MIKSFILRILGDFYKLIQKFRYIFLVAILFLLPFISDAKPLEKVSLQLQWPDQFQFAGYYMAKEKGFYNDVSLDVEIKKFYFEFNIVKAIKEKKTTYAIGRSSLIINKSRGAKIKLLASIFQSSPTILLATKDSNITRISDFIGKRIMTLSDPYTTLSTQAMINQHGLSIDDMVLQKHSLNIDDLINNKTDLILSYISDEPFLLQEKGIKYTIFNPKDYGFDFYSDILFTSDDEIIKHRQRAINFTKASLKGWEYAFSHIDETVELILEKYNTKHKSKASLLYEAKKLKELAYYKTDRLGYIDSNKMAKIDAVYNVMGYVKDKVNLDELIFDIFETDKTFLTDREQKYLDNKKVLNICIDPKWMPFESFKDKKHIGLSADYLNIFRKKLDIPLNVVYTRSWKETLAFAKSRKCDIISLATKTPQREKYLNFTKPLITTPIVFATKLDTSFIIDFTSMKDKKVAIPSGYSIISYLKTTYPNLEIIEVKNLTEALERVKDGKVYGAVGSLATITYLMHKKYAGEIKISGKFEKSLAVPMAIRNDNDILIGIFQKLIAQISDEEHYKIFNKWITLVVEKEQDYSTIFQMIGVFVLILFLILIFMLRQNLKKDGLLLEQAKISQKKLNKSLKLFGENVISLNIDPDGMIIYASKALSDISGYTQEEFMGKHYTILRDSDMPQERTQEIWKIIQSGEPWYGEIKNRKKNGEYFWARTSIIPEFDEENNIVSYISIQQDITPQKVKEEFMANMSHELRTPLNAIIGFSGILQNKESSFDHQKLAQQINSSSNGLLMLINDILDLSKIQNTTFKIEKYKFNAYEEIEMHSHQFNGLTVKKELNFDNQIDETLKGEFLGDWLRISQIILNLISNAIKFTAKNGKIKYTTLYKEGSLIITIYDNGIGMDEKTQDRIFKPFEQADGSTTRKYGGTGLGLSITQKLVEMMNGKIELTSQLNVGTTFTVTLPLEKIQTVEIQVKEQEENSQEKENSLEGHILIVEDNKTNQMLITMLVDEFGLTSDIANDGLEAVKIYNPQKHNLILMDENMPNMNGIEAMKILKERYKEECGAIIALTANAMSGDRERFLEQGMDGYISKPIDEDKLYVEIKYFLGSKGCISC